MLRLGTSSGISNGWSSESPPAIGHDGTIYFGSRRTIAFIALDGQTGVKKWEFQTGGIVKFWPSISGW